MKLLNSFRFRLFRFLSLKNIKKDAKGTSKVVYLTFDDGPEPEITEFVLDELKKYNFKATFFCVGKNCLAYPLLLQRMKEEGHRLGNHTYQHISGFKTRDQEYLDDVDKCEHIIGNHLFRPPWGALTFRQYRALSKKFKLAYWSRASSDTDLNHFNLQKSFDNLVHSDFNGDVVLFHFCKRHEKETKQILPLYLKYLYENQIKTGLL